MASETCIDLAWKLDRQIFLCWGRKITSPGLAHRLHENNLMRVARDSRIAGLGNNATSIPEDLFPAPSLSFFYSRRIYLGLWVTQIATTRISIFSRKIGRIRFPHPSLAL